MSSILIVDDEAAIADMYKLKFEQNGYTVFTAANGEEGISSARENHPDSILLDIIMPKVNGLDVLKRLKEDPETKDIPIFMTTNLPEHTSGEKSRALGAEGYLVKAEYDPSQILEIVQKALAANKPTA